jgi:hypothetical protein
LPVSPPVIAMVISPLSEKLVHSALKSVTVA